MAQSPTVPSEQERHAEAIRSGSATEQHMWRNIGLISGREYKNQVTQRIFLVTSIIYLVVVIIGSFVPTVIQYISAHNNAQTTLVVINNAGSVAGMSDATLLHTIDVNLNGQGQQSSGSAQFAISEKPPTALNAMRNNVKGGQLDLLLVIDRSANQDVRFTYYTTSSDPTDSNTSQVQSMVGQLTILDRAARQHLSAGQINSLFAQPQFAVTDLQENQSNRSLADTITGYILSYVGTILIFITVLTYGSGIAQGVAAEKSSRVMEILILATTPFQLLTGKIIGIGAAGLTQVAAFVLVGIGMLSIQIPIRSALLGSASSSVTISITGASVTLLLLLLLYFILSFALYSSLYAAAGALVSRQEDARNAGSPITLLFMVGYIVSVSLAAVPGVLDSTWFKIMSYVPFWTPTMMLARIGAGAVAWWEILLTVVLMAAFIPLCTWISARIYRYSILTYGQSFSIARLARVVRTG